MTAEPIIKTAMSRIGLEDKADDLLDALDEIWLDARLQISIEQADRGEGMPAEEVENRIKERIKNGYYAKNGR